MSNVHSLLDQRTQKSNAPAKMAAMAEQSANGQRSSFAGVFSVAELSEKEKGAVASILSRYAEKGAEEAFSNDLSELLSLTSEVKAINNQAALLHGERIKKAHTLLTRYRDGAFTAWLIAVYGNRQTPYNLMQYYEFYQTLPRSLRPKVEEMPRQAIYVLASRKGEGEKKKAIIEHYAGETKAEMLALIRQAFPLKEEDGRKTSLAHSLTTSLEKWLSQLTEEEVEGWHKIEKREVLTLLKQLQKVVSER